MPELKDGVNISSGALFYRNKFFICVSMQFQFGSVTSGTYCDVFTIPNYNTSRTIYAPVTFTGEITGNLRITGNGIVGIRPYSNITSANWANVCFVIPAP